MKAAGNMIETPLGLRHWDKLWARLQANKRLEETQTELVEALRGAIARLRTMDALLIVKTGSTSEGVLGEITRGRMALARAKEGRCKCVVGPEWSGSPNPKNPDNEW